MKQFDHFCLDTRNECLWRGSARIPLPPKPYAILNYLLEHPGRLITHDELLDALWPETYVQPQVLRTYMLDLRKALGDDAAAPRYIQTLPKRGYCFVAPVNDCESVPHEETRKETRRRVAASSPAATIVDRTDELSRLAELAESAAAGQRQVAFVTGVAGIGKSALIEAFTQHIGTTSNAMLARGQCVEGLGAREEYYPVMEAIAQLCSSADGDRACQLLLRIAPAWLPALERKPNPASANSTPSAAQRMPGDLCVALEELALEQPLVLIFEDMQWADHATLDLLSALARRRTSAKLMVLATLRPLESAREHPLKALKQDLSMRRLCAEIALPPLNRIAIGVLLSRQLGQDQLPDGLDNFVYQNSEGNPLFAIAILEHLIAERQLTREGNDGAFRWKRDTAPPELEITVPSQLAQMIELEIERLHPQDQRLLEAASLASIAFPAWAVAAALDEEEAETEEACNELARRLHFVHRAGEDELPDGSRSAFFAFAHGLYREVLYQRQSAAQRARRHTRVAERLQQLFLGREDSVAREIACHYEAAGKWSEAAAALRAAARHARQRHAWREAESLLEHTLRIFENLEGRESDLLAAEIRLELSAAHDAIPAVLHPKNIPAKLDDFWMGP